MKDKSSRDNLTKTSPAVFIFGDSLFDIGQNNYVIKALGKAKYPHYGVDFFNSTPSGRFSNGLNIADFMARVAFGESVTSPPAFLSLFYDGIYDEKRLATAIDFNRRRRWQRPVRSFNSPSRAIRENPAIGINFASAGSAILDFNTAVDQALTVSNQVTQLIYVHGNLSATIGSWKTQLLFAKSTFFFGFGNNDVHFYALRLLKTMDRDTYIDTVVQNYNKTLQSLYNLGARKFAIFGIPYLGCSPLMRVTSLNGSCSQTANDLAAELNTKLEQLLWNMMISSKGMVYSFANSHDLLHDLYDNPERYNFRNVTYACCGSGRFNAMTNCLPAASLCENRDEYLFWDFSHPTERAARLMVESFAFGGPQYARPINWARLVSL
ncbi:SGNH hydrolase-type esterase domain-containing protein [Artemisia annua]|uniref:SGNH hydrolase-type esterase domain-containing protein n=1 Tax=Artemisia annua TaxID=35608 RepID=A0A2U1Q3W6_ARTAN|nr:SGNH hydrolase-type esterase domain-containing protein [Artemisia annua]